MTHYIGIDIGTTSTKTVAFSEDGKVIAQHGIAYEMQHPKPDWSEQNPEEIFEAVYNSLKIVSEQIDGEIEFASFSSAMHNLIAVDEAGKPLTNCILWADNRANDIANSLKMSNLGTDIYENTGVPIHPMTPLCKLIWLRENDPEIFKKAHKFIGIKEYIWFKLFGKFQVDYSLASGMGLLNLATLKWDELALKTIGITEKQLPELVSTNYEESFSKISTFWRIKFIMGGADGPLANLGSGATKKGTMAVTIGTSGAVRICSEKPYFDVKMRTFAYILSENQYVIGGATNNGAVVIQWLKEQILQTNESHEKLIQLAESAEIDSEGLLFLPYILGERAPIWNAHAKGILFGLDINHSKAHFVRAAMEGIILNMYSIGKILMERENIAEIYASGGFAKSDFWLQILADVFQKKVIVSDTVESSAWGAVLLGMGKENSEIKNEKIILPNLQNKEIYQKKHLRFERIYEKLKDEM
jgi:gluconokinase